MKNAMLACSKELPAALMVGLVLLLLQWRHWMAVAGSDGVMWTAAALAVGTAAIKSTSE